MHPDQGSGRSCLVAQGGLRWPRAAPYWSSCGPADRTRLHPLTPACQTRPVLEAVAVDTTEITNGFLLDSNGWRKVLSAASTGSIDLLVSEVSILEAERQYAAALEKEQENRAGSRLSRLGVEPPDDDDLIARLHKAASSYRERITEKLTTAGAWVLPIPEVPHAEVVERDLARRKPFANDGKGYRDFLIWAGILDYLENQGEATTVRLATHNFKDFAADDDTLHPDLVEDIDALDLDHQVVLYRGLPALAKDLPQFAMPVLPVPTEDRIRDAITSATVGAAESDPFNGSLDEREMESFGLHEFFRAGVYEVDVDSITALEDTADYAVYEVLEGDTQLVSSSVEIVADLSAFIDKGDYYRFTGTGIHVIDGDWNDHTMLIGIEGYARAYFSITVIGESVEDVEFDFVEPA